MTVQKCTIDDCSRDRMIILMKNMNISNFKDRNANKLQIVTDILKKHIDQYIRPSNTTKLKPEIRRLEKIQKLTSSELKLSTQFQQIRQEIQRYERKYEKLLTKVRLIKVQILQNRQELDIIKHRYQELNAQIVSAPCEIKEVKKNKSKQENKSANVHIRKSKSKEKNMKFKKGIGISIKQNERLDKREIHFVKDCNEHQEFIDLTKILKPVTTNIRECKIMLQKLTEEQVAQYINEGGLKQRKRIMMHLRQNSHQNVNKNDKPTV